MIHLTSLVHDRFSQLTPPILDPLYHFYMVGASISRNLFQSRTYLLGQDLSRLGNTASMHQVCLVNSKSARQTVTSIADDIYLICGQVWDLAVSLLILGVAEGNHSAITSLTLSDRSSMGRWVKAASWL